VSGVHCSLSVENALFEGDSANQRLIVVARALLQRRVEVLDRLADAQEPGLAERVIIAVCGHVRALANQLHQHLRGFIRLHHALVVGDNSWFDSVQTSFDDLLAQFGRLRKRQLQTPAFCELGERVKELDCGALVEIGDVAIFVFAETQQDVLFNVHAVKGHEHAVHAGQVHAADGFIGELSSDEFALISLLNLAREGFVMTCDHIFDLLEKSRLLLCACARLWPCLNSLLRHARFDPIALNWRAESNILMCDVFVHC